MKILPVFIRRRVIRIRFLNFLKKESHSFVLRGTVAMLFLFRGQSENSVAILLSGYSFVSLRHETMASITDSIS